MRRFAGKPLVTVATVVALVLVGVSVTALATTAGKKGKVYQACVSKSSGELYKVTSKAKKPVCKTGDKVISWNQTGPAGPAGVPGVAGPSGPSGPSGPAGTTGQSGTTVFGSGPLNVASVTAGTLVPGLTQSVTVPAGATIYVSSNGGVRTTSSVATGFSSTDVYVALDGFAMANGFYSRQMCINNASALNAICRWSLGGVVNVAPGAHTIAVMAAGTGSGADATVGGDNTSVLQGDLSVLILKN